MALRREFPCDEVEIRLFELDLDRNLSICARQIHQGYTFWRNAIEFKAPKDSQNMRPKVVDSVSDAVVGTAFLHVIGRPIDSQFLRVSCGNRLEKRVDSEYIYRWFWPAWYYEYYISSIEEAAKRGLKYYCQMDIESFYPSISQAQLMKKLDIVLPRQNNRIQQLIQSLIIYNLDNSYGKLLKSKTEEFIRTYSRLLRELGIYISEQWLLRRLVFKGYIHQYMKTAIC